MTTKEQERKALEQIKKIVAGLGEDSYVGTAFEGCFEIAEQNINNDWACSMKQRAESAEKQNAELVQRHINEKVHLQTKIEALEKTNEGYKSEIQYRNAEIQKLQHDLNTEREACDLRRDEASQYLGKVRKMQEVIDSQHEEKEQMALEIMKLKARLFDLMEK